MSDAQSDITLFHVNLVGGGLRNATKNYDVLLLVYFFGFT